MVPIITLLFVVGFSMLVTKVATIALTHTGMSRNRARFQARSAFSGAGFTTQESEMVVKHPVRRRIIMILILVGNAGLVTAVSTLILGFVSGGSKLSNVETLLLLFFGLGFLFFLAKSQRLDRLLTPLINRLLDRYTGIRTKDFSSLMNVMEDFEIAEVDVGENEWMKGRTLAELNLDEEGLLALGIIRGDNTYIGVPRGKYEILEDDKLVIYGKTERIAALSERKDPLQGKAEHEEVVAEHEKELEEQDEQAEAK
ncbi:TrkA C-terminal domain-containing protein [Puniceicoccus vermicola]|uniref:Potassium transporter TrkA n=1 Tax=Puniceicoccus vermicola TaxID=388746 RepID=A0A7X1AZ86_9BACT|nr:TrkA C-terminal domain-containing protein [Puniceicoccus vermicola]MBC2601575.1 potassium transporter TrkA [Puniceicoccus vermicola]